MSKLTSACRRRSLRHHGGAEGFTMVEILVTLVVAGIALTFLYQVFGSFYGSWVSEGLKADMRQNVRVGLDAVTRDIEMAGYHTTQYGDPNKAGLAITLAANNEIEVDQHLLDIDDGSYQPRMIYYHLATDVGTGKQNLYRQVRVQPGQPAADEIVAENVDSFNLTYFDADGNAVGGLPAVYTPGSAPPAALKAIRRVCVAVTAGTSRPLPTGATPDLELSTCVTPKNLAVDETIADATPPCVPSNLRVVDTRDCTNKLCVRWDKCLDADLDGYRIYYGAFSSQAYPVDILSDPDNPQVFLRPGDLLITKDVDRLVFPNTYDVSISAYDSSGNYSGRSGIVSGNPLTDITDCAAGTGDTTVNPAKPSPPENFAVGTGAEYELTLTWDPPADGSATEGYRLYRSETPFADGANIPSTALIADEGALDSAAGSYTDAGLIGCRTYYYAVASVNCDETLVPTYTFDTSGGGDYAAASGAPLDTTAPPPASLAGTVAGWKRIFITLLNPTTDEAEDFQRTEIYYNEGTTCPSLNASGGVDNGDPIPDSDSGTPGTFVTRGSQTIQFDSTTVAEPAEPTLTNEADYCLLALIYDECQNTAEDSASVLLINLCGDDPPGPPPDWPTNPVYTSCDPEFVLLAWEYPPKYLTGPGQIFDFAGYRIWREGPDAGTEIELTSAPTWNESWTDAGDLQEGGSYRYTVRATDCVYENRRSEFPNNFSTALFIPSDTGWIQPGRIEPYGGNLVDPFAAENFVTAFSDPAEPYTNHNNVKFFVQNTSASTMTIEEMTIDWQNPNVILDSVTVGGSPSTTTRIVTPAGGKVSGEPVAMTVTVSDTASGVNQPGDPVPVELRFVNTDGSVNRFTDLRSELLTVSLRVRNNSLQQAACDPESFLVFVPPGPILGDFFQDPSCRTPTPSLAVPGPTGTARDADLEVPAATPINVFGTVFDTSGSLFPDGLAQGFDTLSLFYNVAAAIPAGDPPVRPTGSPPTEIPLIQTGGAAVALYDAATASGTKIPDVEDLVVWYDILAVDRTGNFDRRPVASYGDFAYYQGIFDLCAVRPLAPLLEVETSPGGASLSWAPPAGYTNCGDLHGSDSLTYDVFVWETGGGAMTPLCADTASLSCSQSADLTTHAFAYAVKAKNACGAGAVESALSNVFYECEGDQDFCESLNVPLRLDVGEPATLTATALCLFAGNNRSDTVDFRVSSSLETETLTAVEIADSGSFAALFATSFCPDAPAGASLAADIGAADSVIPLVSATCFPPQGAIDIDGEVIRYTGVSGNDLTGALRGVQGTVAADHFASDGVSYLIAHVVEVAPDDTLTVQLRTGSTVRAVKYANLGAAGCADVPDPPSSFAVTRDTTGGALATVTWQAPALNADGSSLVDLAGYQIEWRRCQNNNHPCANWQSWPSDPQLDVDDACAESQDVTIQEDYEYQFMMRSKDSCPATNSSAWTAVETID